MEVLQRIISFIHFLEGCPRAAELADKMIAADTGNPLGQQLLEYIERSR